MGRTGELVKKILDRGFNPAWSPDGQTLAFSTQGVTANPGSRAATGAELWVVTVASGETRRLTVRRRPAASVVTRRRQNRLLGICACTSDQKPRDLDDFGQWRRSDPHHRHARNRLEPGLGHPMADRCTSAATAEDRWVCGESRSIQPLADPAEHRRRFNCRRRWLHTSACPPTARAWCLRRINFPHRCTRPTSTPGLARSHRQYRSLADLGLGSISTCLPTGGAS